MFAVVAAVLFILAFIAQAASAGHVDELALAGLAFVAVHLAWPVYPWRRRAGE